MPPFRCDRGMAVQVVTVVFDLIMRVLGPVLVTLATAIIGMVTVVYFTVIMPHVTDNFSLLWWTLTIPGLWLLFNILFNYYMCILTPPGNPPTDADVEAADPERSPEDPRKTGKFSSFCKRCDQPKPPRTHHCHICKKCVLRMDHHCPWVGNCVGHFNYRYFYLFLFYLWVGSMYAATLSFFPFMDIIQQRRRGRTTHQRDRFSPESGLVFTFVISLTIGAAISLMLAWHTYLIFTAQTTIEFYGNRSRANRLKLHGRLFVNPYDLGRTRNWQSVFGRGKYSFSWLMPTRALPPTNGTVYPTRNNPNPPPLPGSVGWPHVRSSC